MKCNVVFVGGSNLAGYDQIYGGTPMTVDCILKSFKKDPEYQLTYVDRSEATTRQILKVVEGADLLHVDDTHTLAEYYKLGITPDVIGVISRSPVKTYRDGWEAVYTPAWFYQAEVIRLNRNEEKDTDYVDRIHLIRHGVDLEVLKPVTGEGRNQILWAGNHARPAKNFELYKQIAEITELPPGYTFEFLSQYHLADYWKALEETCIVINTSKWESFCCAMFEAKARGIPVIYKKGLHGKGVHDDCRIQVEYTPEGYRDKIQELLAKPELLLQEGKLSREYVEKHATLKQMNQDIRAVYDLALKKKIHRDKQFERSFINEYFENQDPILLKSRIRPAICWEDIDKDADAWVNQLQIPEGTGKILEIGCGIGRLLKPLSRKYECTGVDASVSMVEQGKIYAPEADIRNVSGDGILDGILDGSMDYVFSMICFQHIPNIETVLMFIRESYRVLKPGGKAEYQFLMKKPMQEGILKKYHNPTQIQEAMKGMGYKWVVTRKNMIHWLIISGEK